LSDNTYLIKSGSLMLPLCSIKNLGASATSAILSEREKGEFKDYLDFIARVYGKSVNKKTIISLIDSGVLDSFNLSKKAMIENLDNALNYAELIGSLDESFVIKPTIDNTLEYEEEILREKEFTSYGFYLKNHPISKYQDKSIIKMVNIKEYFDKHIKCVVLIEKIKTIKTKKGDNMAFINASDETGEGEFILFPKAYYMLTNLQVGDIISIQGRVTKRFDEFNINIDFLNKI